MSSELHLLTSIEYSFSKDGLPTIHLFSRTRSGERVHTPITDFRPYFFVKDKDKNNFWVTALDKEAVDLEPFNDTGSLWKVFTDVPAKVGWLVKNMEDAGYETFEGKVRFPVRFLIDSGIKSYFNKGPEHRRYIEPVDESTIEDHIESVRMFLDIETVHKFGIVAITVWDSKLKQYGLICQRIPDWARQYVKDYGWVKVCESEEDLLWWFLFYFRGVDPDWISHWYGDKYDIPQIIDRMKWYGINYKLMSPLEIVQTQKNGTIKIHGRENVDLWRVYKFLILRELKSFRLKDVCEREEIPVPKIEIPNFLAAWVAKPWLVIQRNHNDVKALKLLDEKLHLIDFVDAIRRFAGCRVSDAFMRTKVIDVLLLRKAREKGLALPSQPKLEPYPFEGGTVVSPELGAHGNVVVADFTSMYPMFIVAMNLSPEMIRPDGTGDIKLIEFSDEIAMSIQSEPEGLITEQARELIELNNIERELFKKTGLREHQLKYDMLKSLRNALYGALAYKKFRLIDRYIPSIITYMGRELMEYAMRIIDENGGRVIYGDTDGIAFVSESLEKSKWIVQEIDKLSAPFMKRFNLEKTPYEMKIEAVYLAYYTVDKKNYAALEENGQIIYKGLPCVRSDTSEYAAKCQIDLLDVILNRTAAGEGIDKDELVELSRELLKGVRKLDVYEKIKQLGVPHKIGKRKYKTNVIQVRAAEYSNKYLKTSFGYGDKPKRIYIKRMPPEYPPTDVIGFDEDTELPEGIEVDVEKCIKSEIRTSISQILKPLGIEWAEVEMRTLNKFFKQEKLEWESPKEEK